MRDLSCDVIRDLLPAVADELASADTEALVKEHIETCADCRAALDAMRAPEAAPTADEREIDYLKKTRKKGWRAVVGAALAVLTLCIALAAVRMFVTGSAGDPAWLMSEATVEARSLTLRCSPNDSAGAVGNIKVTEEDGVVTVNARRVLTSPLHRGSAEATYEAAEPIRRVVVNGRVVWDEGARITPYTAKLFALRNPYVGDASADMALLRAVLEGDYTIELQTEAEPYGMTVRLPEHLPGEIESLQPALERVGCVLLALTENLGEATFTFGDFNNSPIRVTAAEHDVKNCYDSPVQLEMLLNELQLRGPVALDAAAELQISIRNGTDLSIRSMTLEQWYDGELRGSETGMYADESPLTRGNTLEFTVPAFTQYELRLTFTTEDGQTYTAEGFDTSAEELTITGSAGEGFRLMP